MAVYEQNDTKSVIQGGMRISREKALEMQYKLITEWEPKGETWPFRFGGAILSAGSIITSLYMMGHYRRKMKLLAFGRALMFVPGVVMPAMMIPLMHQKIVTDPLVLDAACPVCIQLRGAVLQTSMAIGYPMLVHSLGAISLASAFATYRLPDLSLSTLGQFWTLWRKISLPLQGVLPWHFAAQAALAFFITEYQAKSFFSIQEKIIQRIKSSST